MIDYSKIYELYHQKIQNYLTRIAGKEAAEDITQEVFIKINKSLDSLKDESKLNYWVYRIALNAARDHIRMKQSRPALVSIEDLSRAHRADGSLEPPEFMDTRAKTPDEKIAKDQMMQCFVDYVEQLPEKYYEVYVLDEFEGLSNQEIAEKLSLNIDTVKIRLHRARTEIQEQLRKKCSYYFDENGQMMCEPKS